MIAASQRFGDLPDLFNEAPERPVDAADPVSFAERRGDLLLQERNIHASPLNDGVVATKTG
ncbi:MAG TPA: hypothetical protein VKW09_06290 [bacterium]|nr:hypothetical protein [bacterium]